MKLNRFIRLLLTALSSIFIYAILWVSWLFVSDLCVFPDDIIGTHYEVPLPNYNKLVCFAIDDHRIVNDKDEALVRRVDSLLVVGDIVVGWDDSTLFAVNTISQDVCHYECISQLKESQGLEFGPMYSPGEFYGKHRKPYDVLAGIVIAILSLGLSLFITRRRKRP